MPDVDYKNLMTEARELSWWQSHKFLILVFSAIAIAIFLVLISMNLYSSSGTAQLDLSRPGYQSVRDQVERSASGAEFSSVGEIDETTLVEFRAMYKKEVDQVTKIDGFGPAAVSDSALGLPNLSSD